MSNATREQLLEVAVMSLVKCLREYADEDIKAQMNGSGCFDDPYAAIGPCVEQAETILSGDMDKFFEIYRKHNR